jgi:hypothetical protein
MRKYFTLSVLALFLIIFLFAAAGAQVDPRDSVILESKSVAPSTNPPDGAALMRVWITNKDTISEFQLSLEETSLSGGAYLTLAYPRTFSGVVNLQTTTLQASTSLTSNQFDGISPDRFTLIGSYNSGDLTTAEPPNVLRKAFWEIRFDTVKVSVPPGSGQAGLDSVRNNPSDRIEFRDLAGNRIRTNFVPSIFTIATSGVRDINRGVIPKSYALSQNYPNPFNANTQITFSLSKAGHTTLDVFNLLGQRVNTLVDEYLSAGTKIASWDGRDDGGTPAPSGIYFYQLKSGEYIENKKMLFLK